jgi:hypothetical protein
MFKNAPSEPRKKLLNRSGVRKSKFGWRPVVPLFWILGKLASGKSTAMDHLSRSEKSEELLQSYISEEWVVVQPLFRLPRAGRDA